MCQKLETAEEREAKKLNMVELGLPLRSQAT